MKILLLADTHFGIRNNNPRFYDYMKKFIDNVLIPYIKYYKITTIVHLGDLVDYRNGINFLTLNRLKNDFLIPLSQLGLDQHYLVGNHDALYKNTLKINALDELDVAKYGIKVYNKPQMFENILMLPWICNENREESMKMIADSPAEYCFGHLSLKGFEIYKNYISKEGEDKSLFSRFKGVYSGHFHHKSKQGNITYIGAMFQFFWNDHDTFKGFCELDTDTGKIKYIRNPYDMFFVIEYDENNKIDIIKMKDTYCRVIVKNKSNEVKFNDFISEVTDLGVIDLSVMDLPKKIELETQDYDYSTDIIDTFDDYVENLDSIKKEKIKIMFNDLYREAQNY